MVDLTLYHGTLSKRADDIIKTQQFIPGEDEENSDFLGKGVYFWEDPLEAVDWNKRNFLKYFRGTKIWKVMWYYCVLEAQIITEDETVFDLNMRKCLAVFKEFREIVEQKLKREGKITIDVDSLTDAVIINYIFMHNMLEGIKILKRSYTVKDNSSQRGKSMLNSVSRIMYCVKDSQIIRNVRKYTNIKNEELKLLKIN